jgi:hypothetical protein
MSCEVVAVLERILRVIVEKQAEPAISIVVSI